jgi:hypothetical protein
MEFTDGNNLIFIEKNTLIPDRVESSKGWILLQQLNTCNNINNLSEINKQVNIKFNMNELNCSYE